MWKRLGLSILFFSLAFLLSGCSMTQSPFANTAGKTGSAFAAASTTLRFAHEKKVSYLYASSAFVNYQSELQDVSNTLPGQEGAPAGQALQQLMTLEKAGEQAVNNPCLDENCDWRSQVETLDRASKAFLEAAEQ